MLINGNDIADQILGRLRKSDVPQQKLVAVLVTGDDASKSFITKKKTIAESLGVRFEVRESAPTVQKLSALIKELNQDEEVGGIIIQLPLPNSLDRDEMIALINIHKDVDNLTGKSSVLTPTILATQKVFESLHINNLPMRAVITGKGFLVGRPIFEWLSKSSNDVTQMDYDALDNEKLKNADVVITGTGKPAFLKGNMVKKGSVLIDFGYAKKDGKTYGDVDVASCDSVASFITPTPGGTGPIVVAALMQNFFELIKKQN